MGCSNFISPTVGLNGHEQKMTPGGRMGCEKIKNTAPAGFNGWPISRISPTEIRITPPPLPDGDRIYTFDHSLYCNMRLIIRCGL